MSLRPVKYVLYFITQRHACTLVGNFYLMRLKQMTVAACSGNLSHLNILKSYPSVHCVHRQLWILCFPRSTSCNHSIHCGKDPFECWEGSCSRARHSATRGWTPPFGWHLEFWLGQYWIVLVGIGYWWLLACWWSLVGSGRMTVFNPPLASFGIPLPQDVRSISPI